MGETQGIIYPEAKFLSNCDPLKPDKLYTFKIQRWNRIDVPIPKGRKRKKKGMTGLELVQNLAK